MGKGAAGYFRVGAMALPPLPGSRHFLPAAVIPAKAGIHNVQAQTDKCLLERSWIPAFAGMTVLQSVVSVTVGMPVASGMAVAVGMPVASGVSVTVGMSVTAGMSVASVVAVTVGMPVVSVVSVTAGMSATGQWRLW